MRKRTSFFKSIQLWVIIFMIAVGGSIIIFDIIISYRDFDVQAERIRTDYIVQQKEMIKQEVDRVVAMINHEKAQSEAVVKEKIKSRVYEAYAIAQHIYLQNKSVKSKPEIKQMIIDVLRPIRFADGFGYYFATRLNGVEVFFADKPELEGLNLLDVQDTQGKYIIKEMIKIVQQSGEGFCEYYWTKPQAEGSDFKKISFVKQVEPFDWFIGTGLYVDDIEASIKERLMGQINKIRFGVNGYIFVDSWEGISLAHGLQPALIGTDMWETEDCKGNKTTQMLVAASKKKEGGYVNYWWRKPTTGNESPKIGYAKSVSDWKFFVGTGVYLDDVEVDIAVILSRLNTQIKTKLVTFALLVIGLSTIFLFFFRRLNRRFKNDFNIFHSFFYHAAHTEEKINQDLLQFVEFEWLAKSANKMVQDKTRAQRDLLLEKDTLRKSEERYKGIMESTASCIAVYKPIDEGQNFIFVEFNLMAEKLDNIAKEEVIGKKVTEVFPGIADFGLFKVF
ncbi:MAG: cache domain-containing protein, partial [Deltaproteobacteria bacterium]|nr:cache domain-containing protein [Deltaproteobacteria bacterium]